MRVRPGSQSHFAGVPSADIQRSTFDRSHGVKTTFDSGWLVPVLVDEALPGDTFNCRMTGFARLATPIFPVMDNLYMESFFFAVPYRLVWDNFQKFMGEQVNPGDSTDYLLPLATSPAGGYLEQSLQDYMGIPTKIASLPHVNLWCRAYNLIWNTWFRDENLQNSLTVDKGDGPDTPANYVLKRRGKRHDYFTSALPWPQKGSAVTLPLGTSAAVRTSTTLYATGAQEPMYLRNAGNGSAPGSANLISVATTTGKVQLTGTAATGQAADLYPGNLYADLSTATAATVNQLRQAFQLQKMLERDARGGTRYTEIIRSHFGVVSPDARLQRPEYLGGGSAYVNIAPVAQTSATGVTGATTPIATLSGFGTVVANRHGFSKSFTEHCLIIGLVSVRADMTYQQGLNKMYSRRTRYDMYWPSLAHIGEQSVLRREIYAQGTANDDIVFGYQERYAEYRYKPSHVTGLFRSNATGTLDPWHLALNFSSAPVLDSTFIQEDPPVDRVIAVPAQPHFLMDVAFDYRCARPMPVYGVPGLIDHF